MSWRTAGWLMMLASLAACGGSSSESPWPVEPVDTEPGPAGESGPRGNVVDTEKLPDNYNKNKAGQGGGEPGPGETDTGEEGPGEKDAGQETPEPRDE